MSGVRIKKTQDRRTELKKKEEERRLNKRKREYQWKGENGEYRNTGFKKNMKEMENQKEWIRNGGGTFKD